MDERPHFSADFLVGIAQVDSEHQRLFEIAGRVYDCLAAQHDAALAEARSAIEELLEYTSTHFASEEGLMEAAGYPDLAAHRAQHRHLLLQARDMKMQGDRAEDYLPGELNHFISNWLAHHILLDDRKFGEFIATRR